MWLFENDDWWIMTILMIVWISPIAMLLWIMRSRDDDDE